MTEFVEEDDAFPDDWLEGGTANEAAIHEGEQAEEGLVEVLVAEQAQESACEAEPAWVEENPEDADAVEAEAVEEAEEEEADEADEVEVAIEAEPGQQGVCDGGSLKAAQAGCRARSAVTPAPALGGKGGRGGSSGRADGGGRAAGGKGASPAELVKRVAALNRQGLFPGKGIDTDAVRALRRLPAAQAFKMLEQVESTGRKLG
eukprot:CAMPEP_0168415544 /NCGR_PEP_ID=MMETSP0228-20121227/30286_1 /TAXON_ID=133427 /ORGANISM="Protoceratium reticulatum, Strain CCCM 535 (=CCMP 1889)" /LENGTH=203 /DNA_ID=CAMNT_0008429355 /DNA_START=75 /DNA_END=682 /DNA_ORIENTATION=-